MYFSNFAHAFILLPATEERYYFISIMSGCSVLANSPQSWQSFVRCGSRCCSGQKRLRWRTFLQLSTFWIVRDSNLCRRCWGWYWLSQGDFHSRHRRRSHTSWKIRLRYIHVILFPRVREGKRKWMVVGRSELYQSMEWAPLCMRFLLWAFYLDIQSPSFILSSL